MSRTHFKALFLASLLLPSCSSENQTDNELGTTRQALATQCTIVLGGSGNSETFSQSFSDYTDPAYVVEP